MITELTLRVGESHHRDVGRDIARMERDKMEQLGLVSGDYIEIVGKDTTYAIVWPAYPEDRGRGLLRIDGNVRNNARISLDDIVIIRKAEAKEAKRITLAPTQHVRLVGGAQYIHRLLEGRPIKKGQQIRVETVSNPLNFVVVTTQPTGPVFVGKTTQINLKDEVIDQSLIKSAPQTTYEDIGGLRREIDQVREMVELPLRHPELFQKMGIDPPKGVLLHGPPGTGKTLIAKAVANETDANFVSISGPEIVSKYYGESEKHLRDMFDEAEKNAPTIIFIDEIDSIAPKRGEVTGEVERRVVAQLLSLMDGLKSRGEVIVIAATNRPNAIDEALRRGGRFDREIEIGIPDMNGRLEILQVHTRGMPLSPELKGDGEDDMGELKIIAERTHGFVGADLSSLAKEAAMHAVRKILPLINIEEEIPSEILDKLQVTTEDLEEALKNIEPSALREVFFEVPQVKWDDIGGLEAIKEELVEAVEWPLKYPEAFEAIHSKPPKGLLLFGPPGTGKTMLAKAIATESDANFISIKGPELLSKYVGESEKAVREVFRKARQASPAIIFFDEVDSIAPSRGTGFDNHVTERVISQILTEMDGMEELKDVLVIAATNRPDMIEPALLRPGRLDRMVYVTPPDAKARKAIFKIHLNNKPINKNVDMNELSRMTDGYVGADIEAICREASILALRDMIEPGMDRETVKEQSKSITITLDHFDRAMTRVKPTSNKNNIQDYDKIAQEFAQYATIGNKDESEDKLKSYT
jgi:transitional endoplasmic reticulum ATPase